MTCFHSLLTGNGSVEISTEITTRSKCHRLCGLFFLSAPQNINYSSDMKCWRLFHLPLPRTAMNTSTFPRPLWPFDALNRNINCSSACWFTFTVLLERCSEIAGRTGRGREGRKREKRKKEMMDHKVLGSLDVMVPCLWAEEWRAGIGVSAMCCRHCKALGFLQRAVRVQTGSFARHVLEKNKKRGQPCDEFN